MGLILNNAAARSTISASPIGTALVESISLLTQANSNTTSSATLSVEVGRSKVRHTIEIRILRFGPTARNGSEFALSQEVEIISRQTNGGVKLLGSARTHDVVKASLANQSFYSYPVPFLNNEERWKLDDNFNISLC